MNRGGGKFGDGKIRGCPLPKKGIVVSKSVSKLKGMNRSDPDPMK